MKRVRFIFLQIENDNITLSLILPGIYGKELLNIRLGVIITA